MSVAGALALALAVPASAAPVPEPDASREYVELVEFTVPFELDGNTYDDLLEAAAGRAPAEATGVTVLGRGPDGVVRPLDAYLRVLPPIPEKEPWVMAASMPADNPGQATGFLSGREVYLSQCHGWIYYDSLSGFSTQRGEVWDTVEDFHNPEGANQYLARYLENAGAGVFATKERDHNTEMAIADNDGTGYAENGSGFEDGLAGFADTSPWVYGEDPFDAGTTRRFPGNGGAVATWTPVVPEDGHYAVYVSWDADPSHAPDAHYRITHPGGAIDRWYDQTRHGSTWQYVEELWLTAGNSLTVELIGDGATSAWLSADAVRIGGGVGDVVRVGKTSGRARWEEGAILYTQFNGAPSTVYDPYGDGDAEGWDPSSRSLWADWEHPNGVDAVYLSWHSNAFDGNARGTTTYFAGGGADAPAGMDAKCYVSGPAVDGSYTLARAVQDQLMDVIWTNWDPSWYDRGINRECFSEVSPGNNDEMPAALVELAFHDNADDAAYLKHPMFRRDASRAMYRGIVDYFADKDGVTPEYLPEPPVGVSVVHDVNGNLFLTWEPGPSGAPDGDPATSWRVYLSRDGRSWDGGTDVDDTSCWIVADAGTTVYARVVGINGGGMSFPSEVVGARRSPEKSAPVLVVGAFDRLDRGMLEWVDVNKSGIGDIQRMDLYRMNDGAIVATHGRAISGAGWFFDSASDEAIDALDLSAYAVVVWATGEESTADESVSGAQQTQLRDYWEGGGTLFVSGAEVLWDLDSQGSAADQAFALDVLGAGMAADAAASTDVDGTGLLAGVGPMDFGTDRGGPYPVEWPDVLASSRTPIATYGSGELAAVLDDGVATFGFPFDAIADADVRTEVAGRVLDALAPAIDPPDAPDGGSTPFVSTIDPGEDGIVDPGEGSDTGDPVTSPRVPIVPGKKGCGCDGGAGSNGFALAFPVLLALVRRRR